MNRKHTASGFTLIELLVVIAIIAVLASVVLASLNSARAKSRDARRLADLKQLQLALELYANDNNGYPVLGSAGAPPSILSTNGYISTIPGDPGSNSYLYWSNGNVYALQAQFEGTGGPGTATTTTAGGLTCSTAGFYCTSSS